MRWRAGCWHRKQRTRPLAGDLALATERICRKLASYLSRVLGASGSYSLLQRSLTLAQAQFPLLQSLQADPDAKGLTGLLESLQAQPDAAVAAACVGLIEAYLTLFATFVGEELARKLASEAFFNANEPEATNRDDNR